MFEIDQSQNSITRLRKRTFSELNLKEREHLQEWIAKEPNALGEELLIIQKEFDDFAGTKERLDLLALDKSGSLVVIENKLDDSGKDVIWQALKYVSYCSSLKTTEIVGIYQNYLDSQSVQKNAGTAICDFLDCKDIDEITLNEGTNQRMIFVAANFRREVTSTALWLISKGIDIKCVKVSPYSLGQKIFLEVSQIIPTKEAEDYMIGMSSKQNEERQTKKVLHRREELRQKFWQLMLAYFKQNNLTLYQNVNPTRDHWLNAGSGISGCVYQAIFSKTEVRADIYINGISKEKNKHLFDYLHENKATIETNFRKSLRWERLDDKIACRIRNARAFDGYNQETWPDMIEWIFEEMSKLEKTIKPILMSYKTS